MNFGDRIKQLSDNHNLHLRQLATSMKIGTLMFSKIELDKQKLKVVEEDLSKFKNPEK